MEYVYCMRCDDMPALCKVGRTWSLRDRIREANSSDTFRPPSGFYFAFVLAVEDSITTEGQIHQFLAEHRCLRRGNLTEFFTCDVDYVQSVFSMFGQIKTVSEDVASTESGFLKAAVKNKMPCKFRQANPKLFGTRCHSRYECYKHAESLDKVRSLGGTFSDIKYDYAHGYLELVLPPKSEWL